jgi:peptide/nickel transport system substrate-binding protein
LLCTLGAIPGCSPRDATDDETAVTIMMPLDEYGLSWHWSSQAQFLVFSPLVARNAEGELEPRLAASWTHSPDYREWTVRLNADARWHDGVPVTAHDVKFTLDLLSRMGGGPIVEVLSDNSYRIRYERPGPGSPLDDYTVIYPKHLFENVDLDTWAAAEFWTHPIGSGPFRHVRTVAGIGFEFEANADYFRGKPRIDRVLLKFGAPQLQHLLSGEVDVLPYVSELAWLRLADNDRFEAHRWPSPYRIKAILWNHRSPLFTDSTVRKALTYAVDREELRRVVGLGADVQIVGGLYSDRQFRRGELPDALSYDPDQAKALLDAAGWRDVNGDGIRERNGLPFRFRLLFSGGGGGWASQGSEAVALFLQDQLRRIGIEVELQPLENLTRRDRVRAEQFEATVGDLAPISRFWMFGSDNQLGYANPRAIELMDRIQSAFDPDSVDYFYREVSRILVQDQPVLFLHPVVATTIVNRRLRGLSAPYRADAIWYLEDLWIEELRPERN